MVSRLRIGASENNTYGVTRVELGALAQIRAGVTLSRTPGAYFHVSRSSKESGQTGGLTQFALLNLGDIPTSGEGVRVGRVSAEHSSGKSRQSNNGGTHD